MSYVFLFHVANSLNLCIQLLHQSHYCESCTVGKAHCCSRRNKETFYNAPFSSNRLNLVNSNYCNDYIKINRVALFDILYYMYFYSNSHNQFHFHCAYSQNI